MITYLRRIGFALALASVVFCSIVIADGVGRAYRSDLEMMIYLALLISVYNCIAFFVFEVKPEGKEDGNKGNFFSLWLKRKRLEEQQRIRELESKD